MSELVRAIHVNEEVKRVLDASRGISVVALNASLTARHAGARAVGFAVVSRELRFLATQLDAHMGALDGLISDLAIDLARSIRERRQLGYIEAVLVESEAHESLYRAMEALIARHDDIERIIAESWSSLERSVLQVLRIAETGSFLARSAKIEAAYGGQMARILAGVADQVAAAIEQIIKSLNNIRRLTGGAGSVA